MTVTITQHAEADRDAAWRATAEVAKPDATSDTYGGYGPTPLDAVTRLAQTLANVAGYERQHGAPA